MFRFKGLLLNVSLVAISLVIGGVIMNASANDEFIYGDCDGRDYAHFYLDADGDGFGDKTGTSTFACASPDTGWADNNLDCDDSDENINPDSSEACNAKDDDCDGTTDEEVEIIFYLDADGDGFGNPNATSSACSVFDNYVANNLDCNDASATTSPDAFEVLNDGIDNNCNGQIDEDLNTTYYVDADGDSYGNPAVFISTSSNPGSGYVQNDDDCDDTNANRNPGLAEDPDDGIDNNCNGQIDENAPVTYYQDADGDGYGNPVVTISSTTKPTGYVSSDDDCDDTNANKNPGLAEDPNDGIDNNCNGQIDENAPTPTPVTYYHDADGDGFGNPLVSISTTTQPAGYVTNDDDCNDANASIHPGAAENRNDGIDNDCDGTIDEPICDSSDCECDCQCDCDDDNDCDETHNQYQFGFKNFGQYVSNLAHMTNQLKWEGKITGKEKGQIMSQKNISGDYTLKYKLNYSGNDGQGDDNENGNNGTGSKGKVKNDNSNKNQKSKGKNK